MPGPWMSKRRKGTKGYVTYDKYQQGGEKPPKTSDKIIEEYVILLADLLLEIAKRKADKSYGENFSEECFVDAIEKKIRKGVAHS